MPPSPPTQPVPPSQTIFGGILVAALGAVVAGVALMFIQQSLGPIQSDRAPPAQLPSPPPAPPQIVPNQGPSAQAPTNPSGAVTTFLAAVGVTRVQIIQCAQRNSSAFVLGRDYSLEVENASFGEVRVKLFQRNDTLEDLLRHCSQRVN